MKLWGLLGIVVSLFVWCVIAIGPFGLTRVSDTTAAPPLVSGGSYFINLNSIVRVHCGNHLGTGIVVDKDEVITAEHVVRGSTACKLGDKPMQIIYAEKNVDLATLKGDTGTIPRMSLNCAGFTVGPRYLLVGYADGVDFAIDKGTASTEFLNIYDPDLHQRYEHVRKLNARVYHGMSGGPIIDEDGTVVGMINALDDHKVDTVTFSREFRDTYVCKMK